MFKVVIFFSNLLVFYSKFMDYAFVKKVSKLTNLRNIKNARNFMNSVHFFLFILVNIIHYKLLLLLSLAFSLYSPTQPTVQKWCFCTKGHKLGTSGAPETFAAPVTEACKTHISSAPSLARLLIFLP